MAPMNLFEKMDKLVSTMNTTTLVMMLLSTILISVMFIFSEKNKKYSYASYILVLMFVGFTFKNSLMKLVDMFIERLFYLFYFPTGAIYMITLVVSHVIFLNSLENKKMDKFTKNTNFVGFGFMQVLCINVLNYLSTSSIDLTSELNFVDDKTMMGILELSMMVFTLWMGILIVKSVIGKMTHAVLSRELEEVKQVEPAISLEVPVVEEKEYKPVLKPIFGNIMASMNEKVQMVKNYKPEMPKMMKQETTFKPVRKKEQQVQISVEPIPSVEEEKSPKMTPELLDKLLRPEPMMTVETKKEIGTTTTTESLKTVSWDKAVIEALNIPNEPIYNDPEQAYMNRIVESVEAPMETVNVEVKDSKTKETSTAVDLCNLLLRKQEDSGHSLEDYLKLKQYLVAEK